MGIYRIFDFYVFNTPSNNCISICYRNLIIMPTDVDIAGQTKRHRVRCGEACVLDPTFIEPLDGSIKSLPQVRGLPESIHPYWIPREPVAWPSCNLSTCQSPVRLVSRQWDIVDWACVLSDRRIHKAPPFQLRFYLWEKLEVAGSQIWAVGVLTDLGVVILCSPPKKPAREV